MLMAVKPIQGSLEDAFLAEVESEEGPHHADHGKHEVAA